MKKILITGANSYIGTSFETWVNQWPNEYKIDTLDVKDEDWINYSFKGYDAVFHVAGIAHVSTDPKMEELYYKVNRDLTVEIATKAKQEHVKQFIFMSSIIVYGNDVKLITKDTIPRPENFYGLSKLQADEAIQLLQSIDFNVVSIRPPMIYGKGSKGNYPRLSKLSRKIAIFPDLGNKRSMLHIDNLCEFIRLIIENSEQGIFYPQNQEYVNTAKLVQQIGKTYDKNIYLTKKFNWIIKPFIEKNITLNKIFGNLIYDKELSQYKINYNIRDFEESINITEEKEV